MSLNKLIKEMKVTVKGQKQRLYTVTPIAYAQRAKMTPNRLRNLKKHAVKPGEVKNSYGKPGFLGHTTDRMPGMKHKRLKLIKAKQIALEMHELQQLARKNAKLAMQTLIEISGNKRAPEATRIAASSVILDRGYGRASQTSITANVTNGKASDITADELDKRVTHALKRVEDLTKRTPEAGAGTKRPINLRDYN